MDDIYRVWIDDPNPMFRLGLACCLRVPGFRLAGESAGLVPEPDWKALDILVFDLGDRQLGWALDRAGRAGARLVGIVGPGVRPGGAGAPGSPDGHCTLLVRSQLTPASFLAGLRAVIEVAPPPPPLRRLERVRRSALGRGAA